MLMVIDVGNTHTVIGVHNGREWATDWRIETKRGRTADELGIVVLNLLVAGNLSPGKIEGVLFSCVVPPLVSVLEEVVRKFLKCEAISIDYRSKTGIPIRCENPKEVGADRIVNAVAAFEKVHGPCIVVDFGTATTFDVVDNDGNYIGGVISPGINLSLEALHNATAQLPRIVVERPEKVIGTNTVACMHSGVFWGYVGLIEGIVKRAKEEYGAPMRVLSTGGLAPVFEGEIKIVDENMPDITMRGLLEIHRRSRTG